MDSLAPGACLCGYGSDCICPPTEQALRHVCLGIVDMSAEQRAWCVSQIGQVEGYVAAEWEAETDADLAYGVLSAWQDFCRDKGLL